MHCSISRMYNWMCDSSLRYSSCAVWTSFSMFSFRSAIYPMISTCSSKDLEELYLLLRLLDPYPLSLHVAILVCTLLVQLLLNKPQLCHLGLGSILSLLVLLPLRLRPLLPSLELALQILLVLFDLTSIVASFCKLVSVLRSFCFLLIFLRELDRNLFQHLDT